MYVEYIFGFLNLPLNFILYNAYGTLYTCRYLTMHLFMDGTNNFTNFEDIYKNIIPQLQCLVGISRSNLVNFVQINSVKVLLITL